MGDLKSIAVNEHPKHCFEGEKEQVPCCSDVSEQLKIEEITTINFDFDANPDLYELAIVNHFLLRDIEFTIEQEKPTFQNYNPPLPNRDIPVLVQSFLI